MTSPTSRPLALTMGEPAGVGAEITLKAWRERDSKLPPFFLIGDGVRLGALADRLHLSVPIKPITAPEEAADVFETALPVLSEPLPKEPVPGEIDGVNARVVLQSIRRAVDLTQAGRASGVVTNPIHKKALYDAGFDYPGHTEFLAALAEIDTPPVMMLASPELRVVPVTVHVSLKDAVATLTTEMIVEKARITHAALQRDFAIPDPVLAIAGLNPHAGEDGAMGREDAAIVAPAVTELKAAGIQAFGPAPPDTLFSSRARATYDAAICMYHDQALIPVKTLDFDHTVNVTLGLPFVRTSPDHGTALDIAGRGIADPTSLLSAIKMAGAMVGARKAA